MTFTIYKNSAGYFRWRLRAANNRIIADSGEDYAVKADCQAGIRLVKTGAPGASIDDDTGRSAYGW